MYKQDRILTEIALNLQFEENCHLSMLNFLVHEHGIPSCCFRSSVISFNNVSCFSVWKTHTLILKCILKYMVLFNTMWIELLSYLLLNLFMREVRGQLTWISFSFYQMNSRDQSQVRWLGLVTSSLCQQSQLVDPHLI